MQPAHRGWLWIERNEPSECADLCPDGSDLPGYPFGDSQVFRTMARNPAQEERNDSKSWRSASSRSEQTRETGFVAALPFLNSCCNVPTTRLKLGAWRPETVRYSLSQLGCPSKRIVRQVGEEGDNVKKGLPRT